MKKCEEKIINYTDVIGVLFLLNHFDIFCQYACAGWTACSHARLSQRIPPAYNPGFSCKLLGEGEESSLISIEITA